jgi:hypothetical protein
MHTGAAARAAVVQHAYHFLLQLDGVCRAHGHACAAEITFFIGYLNLSNAHLSPYALLKFG